MNIIYLHAFKVILIDGFTISFTKQSANQFDENIIFHSFEIEFEIQNLFNKHSCNFCFTMYYYCFCNIHSENYKIFLM